MRGPLVAAAAVVFVGVVNSFAVPQVLGSAQGYQTLATLVYQQLSLAVGPAEFAGLCVIALLMVLLVLMAVGAADRGLGRAASTTVRFVTLAPLSSTPLLRPPASFRRPWRPTWP